MGAQITQTKAAVSVSEMARIVGLSRARFYQLMGTGTFPAPSYDPETNRPYFDEAQQVACLKVRSHNVGIDGKPVLFYAKRSRSRPSASSSRSSTGSKTRTAKHDPHAYLLDAIKALGLTSAAFAQVEAAMAELYPHGAEGCDQGEVIRAVFLKLKENGSASSGRSGS